jgi:hypothetical protein
VCSVGEGMGWVSRGSNHSGIVLVGLVSSVGSFPPSERISLEPLYPFRRALCMSWTAPLCLFFTTTTCALPLDEWDGE